jgi:signal transduction histidine kinase
LPTESGVITMHGDVAIAGIQVPDLVPIAERVIVLSVVVTFLGIGLLRVLAAKSVGLMLTIVVGISVLCSLLGVIVIAWLTATASDRDVMLDLISIAGLGGFAVAMFVGHRLVTASHALSSAVRGVSETGVYVAPRMTLPAELNEVSEALEGTHERLVQALTRERALETSRRELVAMAEALEDEVVIDPREVSQYHTQIRLEVNRLTAMIDDLFELSRIHAGALRLSRRLVGLEDLVAEVVASAEPVTRAKGIRLTGAAVRGMPVFVDTAEMGRALRNLVTNAIRHTPPEGGIDVQAEVQSGMACVVVSDACGGIPPGDLPRVFDVAFRGKPARTPGPQEGAGLGLSIARGIVEAHSGQIAVRNAGPGCQFLIRLPLARPVVPAASQLNSTCLLAS